MPTNAAKKIAKKPVNSAVVAKPKPAGTPTVVRKTKAAGKPAAKSNANNERLRVLIENNQITQEEALKRFNVGFGIKPVSMNAWKSYFVDPGSARHRHFGDILLAHAEKKLG